MYRKLARVPRGLRAKQVTVSTPTCFFCGMRRLLERCTFERLQVASRGDWAPMASVSAEVCRTHRSVLANPSFGQRGRDGELYNGAGVLPPIASQ